MNRCAIGLNYVAVSYRTPLRGSRAARVLCDTRAVSLSRRYSCASCGTRKGPNYFTTQLAVPPRRTFSVSSLALNSASDTPIVSDTLTTSAATHTEPLLETSATVKWATDAAEAAATGLPTQGDFTSLGLGGYSPVGLIQWSLEYLHTQVHLPWWAAIIASTVVLRIALLPIAIKVQANGAKLNNIRPETEKLMAKMKQYKQAGNMAMAEQVTGQLYGLYQKHGCNPFKMLAMPLVQVPLFISFFIAIRRMATVPVESMKVGGVLWFTDLTVPDPYYALPFMACFSFIALIEMGGEAGVTNPQMEKMKIFFRAMSILMVPVTATFPTGLFMYWLTTSYFSMGQILLLKVPSIRSRLGIPELIKHPDKGKNEGGFVASLKENYRNTVLVDEAKKKVTAEKKKYNQILKDPTPKLYDKPPHRR